MYCDMYIMFEFIIDSGRPEGPMPGLTPIGGVSLPGSHKTRAKSPVLLGGGCDAQAGPGHGADGDLNRGGGGMYV